MMAGLVLAAGAGRRLGRGPKALLDLTGEGRTQVERTVAALRAGGCEDVVVVVGAGGEQVRDLLRTDPCRVIHNPEWESGMASSFRLGVDACSGGFVMVALVDQPDLTADLIEHLRNAAAPDRVVAAGYPGDDGELVRGHPLIFPVDLARAAAASAHGDVGARDWLHAHPRLVELIDVGAWGTGADIDTPGDLRCE